MLGIVIPSISNNDSVPLLNWTHPVTKKRSFCNSKYASHSLSVPNGLLVSYVVERDLVRSTWHLAQEWDPSSYFLTHKLDFSLTILTIQEELGLNLSFSSSSLKRFRKYLIAFHYSNALYL